MRKLIVSLTIAMFLVCHSADGQETTSTGESVSAAEQAPNVERRRGRGPARTDHGESEHLKVLEPLLGKFKQTMRGGTEVIHHKYWAPSKRMIVTSITAKQAGQNEFENTEFRGFLYWNAMENRIELLRIHPENGRVETFEVTPEDENLFTLTRFSVNHETNMDMGSVKWIMSDEGFEVRLSRKNAEGLGRLMRIKMPRIE